MSRKHPGTCALCGRYFENLSFEHIPPKASFNSKPVRSVKVLDLIADEERMPWEIDALQYQSHQRGMGVNSLCEACNSFTGDAYGKCYANVAKTIHVFLSGSIDLSCTGIEIDGVYPQRFIKQVVSMFCSVNRLPCMEDLQHFVLDKNAVGLDRNKYMIRMYLTRNRTMRHIPITGQCKFTSQGKEFVIVSEITGYPFGFILYLNPDEVSEYQGFDITHWGDYGYDDTVTVTIPLCIKEANDIFPLVYRSREEIQKRIIESETMDIFDFLGEKNT